MVKVQTNSQGKVYTSNGKALLSSSSSGKYQLLERIKDDNNVEIGTVSGFFIDTNNVEYAVVCLDAQYRLASATYSTTQTAVTNMPLYNSLVTANMWESKVTATTNTSLILASVSSPACTHCRSKSFLIDGIRYYGQLPNMKELSDIISNYNAIEQLDTSASSYSSTNFSTVRGCWSTNQYSAANAFRNTGVGAVSSASKTTNLFVCPVLEIPNQ